MSKIVALLLFLHPCHCQMKDSNRIEFVDKGKEEPEDKFDPNWLAGAIEHKFCRRVEPDVATTSAGGDAGPADTTESGEPVPDGVNLATPPDSAVAADTVAGGDGSDGSTDEE